MITEDRKKRLDRLHGFLLAVMLFGSVVYGLSAYADHSFYHVLVACAMAGAAIYLLVAKRRTD